MRPPLFPAAAFTLLLITAVHSFAEPVAENAPASSQRREALTVTVPVTINYLEALPEGYGADAKKRWPLVIFLHGSGERGTDLQKVAKHGPPKRVEEGKAFPFILLSPQCPAGQWWDIAALDVWLDEVVRKYRVDPERIYLTGLSMGGYGSWGWAQRSPKRFAAIVPVCGGGDPKQGAKLKDLPVWAFHGAKDPTVPLARTEEMIAAIKEAGGEPRVTIYPEAAHDSWTAAYADDEVFTWLLAQKRPAMGN
ncbi:MAG: Alpha/beta hydrolase family protein [Rariglobus sp.]|jgi:predicted peptidase|nr:Alpha/beta hydrolase family protein [Rariglobus sp.]